MNDAAHIMKKLGVGSLRPLQKEVLQHVSRRKSVIACLPTAYGKSLCFQLPALMSNSLTIVISPLIATINDQVSSINRKMGKQVAMRWHSEISKKERDSFVASVKSVHIIYCSPESIVNTNLLASLLRYRNVCRVVIDEAHFISSWGDSFRPAFKQFPQSFDQHGLKPHWMVLTATATNTTLDCIRGLFSVDFEMVQHEPIKDNIHYQRVDIETLPTGLKAMTLSKKMGAHTAYNVHTAKLVLAAKDLIQGEKTLIFCLTRRRTEEAAKYLEQLGIKARYYHGGMSAVDKSQNAQWFAGGEGNVLVATNAFGVGIDIPDVKNVMHFETPLSIDAYVQETGRAGRNGNDVNAIYFCSNSAHSAGNSLISMSYPKTAQMERILDYLLHYSSYTQGFSEVTDACYEVEIPLDVNHAATVLDFRSNIVEALLGHLVNAQVITLTSNMGLTTYTLHKDHNFDISRYDLMKHQVIRDFGDMKHYSLLENGAESQYLASFYPFGRPENQVLLNHVGD